MTVWTPKFVSEELIEAVAWVRQFGAPAGPSGIRSSMPSFIPTLEDHLEEGWGIPESADDLEERELRLPVGPERAQQLNETLHWIGRYVVPTNPLSAKMLSLWVLHRSRGKGRGFEPALARLKIHRGHAYRLRDRALSIIAQGLTADGVTRDEVTR